MKALITRSAFKDLAAIWGYIAADSIDVADRVVAEIRATIHRLAENPGMGHRRSDVANPRYRFWAVFSYLIAYRVHGQTLYVSRVIHGSRDVGQVMRSGRR